jgi:pimeloyl-ACP methyl ester carboxylesterase
MEIKSMPHALFRVTCVTLLLVVGCVPFISPDAFLGVANDFALAPDKDCLELANEFGLPAFEGVSDPGDLGLDFREETIEAADGRRLRGWFLPAENEQGVVLFSYGAVGDMSCYLWIALNLVERGWSVAMYDFTGFGGSSGTASLDQLVADGRAAFDWVRETTTADPLVLMGVSLGTIPTVACAAEYPERVTAVIVDGPISLDVEVARFSILLGLRPWDYVQRFPDALRMELQIPDVVDPLLAFTYGRDEFASGAVAANLLAQSGGAATIRRYERLPHARGPYFEPGDYFTTLASFLRNFARDPETMPTVDLGSLFDFEVP